MAKGVPADPLTDLLDAWQGDDASVGGAELMNALQGFNDASYVVDPHGGYIGMLDGTDVSDVHPNDAGAFWDYVM